MKDDDTDLAPTQPENPNCWKCGAYNVVGDTADDIDKAYQHGWRCWKCLHLNGSSATTNMAIETGRKPEDAR